MNIKKVYAKRIAYELKKQGFEIITSEISDVNPKYFMWTFESTPELEKAFGKIVSK